MSASTPDDLASRSWWPRNKAWVFALIPLLVAAVAATSFRLVSILPTVEYVAPVDAHGPTVDYHHTITLKNGTTIPRNVKITTLGVEPTSSFGTYTAAPGATLQKVTLSFEATSETPMGGCQIVLLDDKGVEYGSSGGKVQERGSLMGRTVDKGGCSPLNQDGFAQDGTSYNWFTGEVTPPAADLGVRSGTWTISTGFAIPSDVKPTKVIVRWTDDTPNYALIELPR